MFFSVVVPVYKAELFLNQCVDSILCQSFKDFELILVDDGSPDGCPQMCDAYATRDSRVKVIHQANGGVVSARKTAITRATGKYVVTVDSDDYIGPDLLRRLHETLEKYPCDMVAFDAVVVGGEQSYRITNSVPVGYYYKNIDDIRNVFMYDNSKGDLNFGNILFSLWSKAIRTDLLKKHQLAVPDEIRKGEDLAVIAPLIIECNSICVIDGMNYYYRINPNSVMHCYSDKDEISLKRLTRYLLELQNEGLVNNAYMCLTKMYFEHLFGYIRFANKYRDFYSKAKTAAEECVFNLIPHFHLNGLCFKYKFVIYCLKHNLLWVLYVIAKFRELI